MKVFITFLLCALMAMQTYCVAVLNEKNEVNKLNELITDASNECIREMNRDSRFINEKGPPTDPCITQDPNMVVCVLKKTGMMNQDGTYNLEHVLSFSETAEERQAALERFNGQMKQCSPTAGGDPCKLVSCFYRLPESFCGRAPNEDDGC